MCPTMNSRLLSTRRPHAPSSLAGTNLSASSQGPLPKLYYFSILFFFFFSPDTWKQLFVSGQRGGEAPLLAEQRSLRWLRSREQGGKDPEQPVPSRSRTQASRLTSPVPPAAPLTRNGTRSPREKGWHNLRSSHPTQLWRLPALPAGWGALGRPPSWAHWWHRSPLGGRPGAKPFPRPGSAFLSRAGANDDYEGWGWGRPSWLSPNFPHRAREHLTVPAESGYLTPLHHFQSPPIIPAASCGCSQRWLLVPFSRGAPGAPSLSQCSGLPRPLRIVS